MQRYFSINSNLELSKDDIYHIKKVMRMKKGDNISIIWDENVYLCEITGFTTDNILYKVDKKIKENNELNIDITVAFTIVNETKTDYILQKCTELGVNNFIPIITERAKIKINDKIDKKITRWNKILKEASEQSYRTKIPSITNIYTLDELIKKEFDVKLLCSTTEKKKSIKKVLQNSTKYDTIIIVVGPEGGITELEEKKLNENDYKSVSLGNTILRTETAPVFAVSAIKYESMR
jgi:16S rRNA (uracil1498-N3)-methyltransferase